MTTEAEEACAAAEALEGIGEAGGEKAQAEHRLMISKIVCENFKSYAGIKELGPFHKVRMRPGMS